MDIERIVVRLVADASQYLRVLDSTQARLLAFGGFVGGYFARQALQLASDYERAAIAFDVMTASVKQGSYSIKSLSQIKVQPEIAKLDFNDQLGVAQRFAGDLNKVDSAISTIYRGIGGGLLTAPNVPNAGQSAIYAGVVGTLTAVARQGKEQINGLKGDFDQVGGNFMTASESAVATLSRGRKLLDDINKLAVESPFTSAELRSSAKQVMAFGFDAGEVIPIISRLGDISVATGSDMDRLTLALGQVRTTGRLMGQELRQFTNAGVPILEYLAKSLNVTTSQVPNLVRQGKISFGDVADAINKMTEEGGIFFGMMDRINKETVSGRWANLKESVQQTGMALGMAFFEAFRVREVLGSIAEWIQGLKTPETLNDMRETFGGIRLAAYSAGQGFQFFWEWIKKNREAVLWFIGTIIAFKAVLLGISLATFVLQWLAWAAAIGFVVLTIYKLIEVLNGLGAFNRIGETLADSFGRMVPMIKESWKSIKDAIAGNDMPLAFEIMTDTLQSVWRTTLLSMRLEWQRFRIDLANSTALEAASNLANLTGGGENGRTGTWLMRTAHQANAERDTWFAEYKKNIQQRIDDEIKTFQRKSETNRVASTVSVAFPQGTFAGDMAAMTRQRIADRNPPHILGEQNAFLRHNYSPSLGGVVVIARQMELFQRALAAMSRYQMGVKLGEEASMKGYGKTVGQLQIEAATATKELENFQIAIGKVADTAAKISRGLFPANWPQVLHAASELQKEFDVGTSAMEKFQRQVGLYKQGMEGPFKNQPGVQAIIGIPGLAGNPGSVISPEAGKFGVIQEFMKLQQGGTNRDRYAPTMLAGSREAAEVFQRSSDQSLTVEQQVLQTLRDAAFIQGEQRDYTRKVYDVLNNNKEAARAAGLGS